MQSNTIGAMKTISLKLPDHLLDLLESEARARRTTKSFMVRECLEKALIPGSSTEGSNCFELACDLAGMVKDLPKDLATNPDYMEDFGK